MSSLVVEVSEVKDSRKHENADRLSVVTVKGWQVCAGRDPETGKNQFEPGDKCVYIPPDSVLPAELSDKLGVTKYLGKNGRVKAANLRGTKSFGLIMAPGDPAWEVGADVAAHYGITKYEPPVREFSKPGAPCGGAEADHPAFHRYYDMENLRNYPELFREGEEVVATEKIHGTNVRLGVVWNPGHSCQLAAGSHRMRRKEFCPETNKRCIYWGCLSDGIKDLLWSLSGGFNQQKNVVLFGELYGDRVQDMGYGHAPGKTSFVAFDIAVNGLYLDHDQKACLFEQFSIPAAPVLYRGPFNFSALCELAEGPTTVCDPANVRGFSGREGIVITTARERTGDAYGKFFSRAQAKLVSFAYHSRKDGTEYH